MSFSEIFPNAGQKPQAIVPTASINSLDHSCLSLAWAKLNVKSSDAYPESFCPAVFTGLKNMDIWVKGAREIPDVILRRLIKELLLNALIVTAVVEGIFRIVISVPVMFAANACVGFRAHPHANFYKEVSANMIASGIHSIFFSFTLTHGLIDNLKPKR